MNFRGTRTVQSSSNQGTSSFQNNNENPANFFSNFPQTQVQKPNPIPKPNQNSAPQQPVKSPPKNVQESLIDLLDEPQEKPQPINP